MRLTEPSVLWSDLKEPVATTRPFYLKNGSSKSVRAVSAMELIVLVNGCLYLVSKTENGLCAGDVLSLDFDLLKRPFRISVDPEKQIFERYESVCEARRGIGRVHSPYSKATIPHLERWRLDAHWLLRTSWTLASKNASDDHQFIWRSDRRFIERLTDKATDQLTALARFLKLPSLAGVFEKKETLEIPIDRFDLDRASEARMQALRGIDRCLDWRAIVLEQYIDQLRSQCRVTGRVMQEAYESEDVFGSQRTSKTLRVWASRLSDHAIFLRSLRVRGFCRIFAHVAEELEETARHLHEVTQKEEPSYLTRVKELLGRVYRTLILLDVHWRLEELLIVTADQLRQQKPFSSEQIRLFVEELNLAHQTLTTIDPLTKEHIDKGFGHNVLPVVTGNVLLARMNLTSSEAGNLGQLYFYLKTACAPL